jgi:hypothetical protein
LKKTADELDALATALRFPRWWPIGMFVFVLPYIWLVGRAASRLIRLSKGPPAVLSGLGLLACVVTLVTSLGMPHALALPMTAMGLGFCLDQVLRGHPRLRARALVVSGGWLLWASVLAVARLVDFDFMAGPMQTNLYTVMFALAAVPTTLGNGWFVSRLKLSAGRLRQVEAARQHLLAQRFDDDDDGWMERRGVGVRLEAQDGAVRIRVRSRGLRGMTARPGSGSTGDPILDRFVALDASAPTALTTAHEVLLPAVNDHGARIEGGEAVAEVDDPQLPLGLRVGQTLGLVKVSEQPAGRLLPALDALLALVHHLGAAAEDTDDEDTDDDDSD